MKIIPAFQVIKDVTTDEIVAAEVLVRWDDGKQVIEPSVIQLESWVMIDLEVALFLYSNIDLYKYKYPTVFINVSKQTLSNDLLFQIWEENIRSVMKEGVEVVIEVTERIPDALLESTFKKIRGLGACIALDDFGTGFSSLSYLRMFQFETVKVDKSLIKGIHQDSRANALFNGLIAMLKSLQIEVVAEGVELESYLPFMEQADIHLMQGFYFDKPMYFKIALQNNDSSCADALLSSDQAVTAKADSKSRWLSQAQKALETNKVSFAYLPITEVVSSDGLIATLKRRLNDPAHNAKQ